MNDNKTPSRMTRNQMEFAFIPCACSNCGVVYFFDAEVPKKWYAPEHQNSIAFLLQFSECPKCEHVGAVRSDWARRTDYTCKHAPEHTVIQRHEDMESFVCLNCGLMCYG
jgi:predicted RNA-binding Zn-ribbon protein involved in translation (DUF1610 family)